jgi:hypothetical protein
MLFSQPELAQKNRVSFEELAAWYTNGGYALAPWMELLDLRKWALQRLD